MHVAVMGAGSLGSLLGGLLAGSHRVTLVGREPHMRQVAAQGLVVTGQADRHVHPATATAYASVSDVDVCLVTVKAFDTAAAAEEMAPNAPPTVVSLQNGLGNEEILREILPHRSTVLAGTTTYGAVLDEPGRVRCTGRGEVVIGDPHGGRSPNAERVAAAFSEAGLATEAASDMPDRLWRKLAINAGVNPVTALVGVKNGAVIDEPLRWIATEAARETARVARAIGFDLEPAAAATEVIDVATATAGNTSSMAQDLGANRRTEIDAINGEVVARAGDVPVPVNRTLAGLVRARERVLGLSEARERENELR